MTRALCSRRDTKEMTQPEAPQEQNGARGSRLLSAQDVGLRSANPPYGAQFVHHVGRHEAPSLWARLQHLLLITRNPLLQLL